MTDDSDLIRVSDLDEGLQGPARQRAQHSSLDGEPVIFRHDAEMLAREHAQLERLADMADG